MEPEQKYTEEQTRTYSALLMAAERLSAGQWKRDLAAHRKAGRQGLPKSFSAPETARDLVALAPKVLGGEVSCEDAMAMLWSYDAMRRFEN